MLHITLTASVDFGLLRIASLGFGRRFRASSVEFQLLHVESYL